MTKTEYLTERPKDNANGFFGFPINLDIDNIEADIAILGVPYGLPYRPNYFANDQSKTPDLLRKNVSFMETAWEDSRIQKHFDWDLGGPLLNNQDIQIIDCGNVWNSFRDPRENYYLRAEKAAAKIFASKATLITIGGDHGITIPILKALPKDIPITLIQIDSQMDWTDDLDGIKDGYASPIKRASELSSITSIFQLGLRGVGNGRHEEYEAAVAYGSTMISAYEIHKIGIAAILEKIPNGGFFYLSIDANGLDPSIMPAVNSPAPGGFSWMQIKDFIHGLVRKGRVLGMDLVEISPSLGNKKTTFVHAERLICNFIGASVRAGYYDRN